MKRIDFLAIIALGLLFTIIIAAQVGLFSSNVKQENIQVHLSNLGNMILSKLNQTEILLHEEEAFKRQSLNEEKARTNQTQLILNQSQQESQTLLKEQNIMLDEMVKNLSYIIDRQNNTTRKILEELSEDDKVKLELLSAQNQSLNNQFNMLKSMDKALKQNDDINTQILYLENMINNQTKDIAKLVKSEKTYQDEHRETNVVHHQKLIEDTEKTLAEENAHKNMSISNHHTIFDLINNMEKNIIGNMTKSNNTQNNYLEDED